MGMRASGEQIEFKGGKRAMPDVLIGYMGLRCMIEGKYDDHPSARAEVQRNATDRVASGIAHIAIGVIYPSAFRTVEQELLKEALSNERMSFCVCTENNFMAPEWGEGNVSDLIETLRRSHEALMQNDVVERCKQRLQSGMTGLVYMLSLYPGVAERNAELLGVFQPSRPTEEDDENE